MRLASRLPLTLLLAASGAACLAYEPLRRQAASDLSCTTSQVEIYEQEGFYQANGCGRSALYHCVVDTQGYQHCEAQGRTEIDTLKMVAPRELKCARSRLKIEDAGEGLYRVECCDRRETFFCRQGQGYFLCSKR